VAYKQRYFIELAYDGTNYHGWQTQPNAVAVQEVLDRALSTVFREPLETLGCGRTDTGVHAKEFFAHFDVESMVHGPLSIAGPWVRSGAAGIPVGSFCNGAVMGTGQGVSGCSETRWVRFVLGLFWKSTTKARRIQRGGWAWVRFAMARWGGTKGAVTMVVGGR